MPIDMLVGTKYSSFHVGETKLKGGLVAQKSPLGGSHSEGIQEMLSWRSKEFFSSVLQHTST